MHRHAVYQCLKKPPTFFDTLAFLKRKRFDMRVPKGPSRTKNTTDSKFTIRSKFATAIVKHYGGHFETTIFKATNRYRNSKFATAIVKNTTELSVVVFLVRKGPLGVCF